MIRILLGIGVFFITALVIVVFGPQLPRGHRSAVKEALSKPLPEFAPGRHGVTTLSGVKIWYEDFGDPAQETILLIMGHSCSALVWPKYFYESLVQAGYHVIRYDNRGLGLSDWTPAQIAIGGEGWKYTLEDMASDALAVLDALEVKNAHIVGASMGGMIGQRLALSHPERVLSLTSIMSTGYFYDPDLRQVNPKLAWKVGSFYLRHGLFRTERSFMKLRLGIRDAISGPIGKDFDQVEVCQSTLYEIRRRAGYNVNTKTQHGYAIKKSGSRLEELKKLTLPTLVLHGDADPLVMPEHGEKYGELIPNAEVVWLKGMGHTLPESFMPEILEALESVFAKGRANA